LLRRVKIARRWELGFKQVDAVDVHITLINAVDVHITLTMQWMFTLPSSMQWMFNTSDERVPLMRQICRIPAKYPPDTCQLPAK